jgi:hypothetical protein
MTDETPAAPRRRHRATTPIATDPAPSGQGQAADAPDAPEASILGDEVGLAPAASAVAEPALRRLTGPVDRATATTLHVERGGINEASADTVEVRMGGIGTLEADEVFVQWGGIGAARAKRVGVEFGSVGAALAGDLQVTQGYAGSVIAREATLEQGFVRTLIAGKVTITRPSAVLVMIAGRVEGNVRPLLDWRGALAAGFAFGIVTSIGAAVRGLRSRR